jgi:hypothetical protein
MLITFHFSFSEIYTRDATRAGQRLKSAGAASHPVD